MAVALAGLVLAGSALAEPGFYEAKRLEPAASFVAGKPVQVWCALDETAWHVFAPAGTEHGLATPGGAAMYLDTPGCPPLRRALVRSTDVHQPMLAATIAILTHEAIHLRGESDEGVTECAAMHEMPRVAVRFFTVRPGKQLRALMADAWAGYRVESPAYRTVCG